MTIKEMAKQALHRTDELIQETGPRLAGTSASLKAADLLSKEMEDITDHVEKEHFILHKGAFLGWIRILVGAYAIGTALLWLERPLITVVLLILSVLVLVFQFFLYKPLIDILYPKKTGCNVIGTIEPNEDVKQQIIVSGHHDSARIFNFFIHQPELYNLRVTGGIGLVVLLLLVALFQVVTQSLDLTLLNLVLNIIVSVGFLLTGQMWFFASKNGTPGAGDNLIASHMAIEIGRYFKANPLTHTRIVMVSFDAEEEGLRGARAYAKAHATEFEEIPTTLLNVDCPYTAKELFFLTSDINGSVKLSTELAEDLVAIAKTKGYPAFHQPIAFLTGGTDAGELAKVGVKATTLIAMPWTNNERAAVYHTPNDTVDAIEPEAIENSLDIFITYISNTEKAL
jgi:hypothetical protein